MTKTQHFFPFPVVENQGDFDHSRVQLIDFKFFCSQMSNLDGKSVYTRPKNIEM